MADVRRSVVVDALGRLGFGPHPWDGAYDLDGVPVDAGPQTIYRHGPSDTFFAFPDRGRPTVGLAELASIREIAVGRGAATEQAFDRAMVAAATAATAAAKRAGRRPTVAKTV